MKYEVSIGEYMQFVNETQTNFPHWLEKDSLYNIYTGKNKDYYSSKGMSLTNTNYPITGISWFNAVEFAKWLSAKTKQTWRLPTEAEWEYAARGGQNYIYSGSQYADSVAWHAENSQNTTHSVGQKKPNGYGLYDMSGNVFEWCSDWYDEQYYKTSPQDNPQGAVSGAYRVDRGGAWYYYANNCRIANRDYSPPEFRSSNVGFRLVLIP